MKYSYSDWNGKKGTVPVIWQEEDYIHSGWYRHPDKTHGFTTESKNYEIYGDNLGVFVPQHMSDVFERLFAFFDLNDLVFSLSKYEPGMILPWHKDNYPTYSRNKKANPRDVVRVMVFLHDSAPGHQLWIEDKFCFGSAGDWYSWQGNTKHMAANLAEVDRYVIQITGTNPNPGT